MDKYLERKIKLTHLRLICAIDTHRQISLAAEEMAITQPTASRMLVEIEGHLGVNLFDRHARGMMPTSYGKAMAAGARGLLLSLNDIGTELLDMQQGKAGSLSVGSVTGAAVGLVIPAVQIMKQSAPKAEITLVVETSSVLIDRLVEGKSDLVLARLPPSQQTKNFDIEPLRTESLQLLVKNGHPLTRKRKVSMSDLVDYEWITQDGPSPIRTAMERAFSKHGLMLPQNLIQTTSFLVMIAYLTSSDAIVPVASEVSELLTGSSFGGKFEPLPLAEPIIIDPYYLVQVKGRMLTPLANRFKQIILELYSHVSN